MRQELSAVDQKLRKEILMIINNTLFERKHRYMMAMREIEILKRQMEYDVLNEDAALGRLDEVKVIWNLLFIGMLREGLDYQYIKNVNKPEKDIIRITIDGVDYNCLLKTIRSLLKEEDFNSIFNYQNPNFGNSSLLSSSEIHDKIEPIKPIKNDEKNTDYHELEATETKESESPSEFEKLSSSGSFSTLKEDITFDNNTEAIIPVTIPPVKEEQLKSIQTFVYDIHHIQILQPGTNIGDEMDVIVYPMVIEANNSRANIFVIIKDKNNIRTYFSQEKASVIAEFNENELLIRGTFANGEFSSYVLPFGAIAAANCSINDNTEEFRSALELANYGHVCYSVFDDSDKMQVHVMPLSTINNKYGMAETAVFVRYSDGKTIAITGDDRSKKMLVPLEKHTLEILSYWQEGFLSSESSIKNS